MTTGENIDSLDNVTITSDEAFERVTSDVKEEYTESDGSLKQNTAGLVQEIPNISILDISDFLIENKKTLYDRQNWNIVVGKAGRSIEAQPQDIARLTYESPSYTATSTEFVVPFDNITSASNITTYSISGNEIVVSQPGVYRVSYGRMINTGAAKSVVITITKNASDYIVSDYYESSSQLGYTRLSGGKTAWVECESGDTLKMTIKSDYIGIVVLGGQDTYLEVQYLQQSL